MRLALALATVVTLACGPDLPDSWTVAGDGVTVVVTRSPYGFTVRDGAGKTVLATAPGGMGDGYGAAAWTTGTTDWMSIASPGYYQFTPNLDPWRDRFDVVAAKQQGNSEIDVTLASPTGGPQVHVKHILGKSTMRVEASVDPDASLGATKQPRAWAAAFSSPSTEGFLGLGERYNRVEQRGKDLYCWQEEGGLSKGEKAPASSTNPFPNGEGMTYYPEPFLMSTDGYGFWLDSTWRNEWNLASAKPAEWRVWHIGPSLAYEIYLPLVGDARPWPYQVIDQFTARTGRAMVPPRWSFGPRRRIDPEYTVMENGQTVAEVQAMRDQGLALTTVDDAEHFLPTGNWIGNEATLAAWTASCAKLGYRVVGYYNPYFIDDMTSPLWPDVQTGLTNKYFLADATGMPSVVFLISGRPVNVLSVDFTSDAATKWYTAYFDHALSLGYSGWMYDFGEYVQANVVTSTGVTGEQYHDQFPVDYDRAAHDYLETMSAKGDWYYFSRSGYTGSQQYAPMVWSGDPDASFSDAEGIPAQVRAGINMGVSGVAHWGSDIGGYKCIADGSALADGEMLTRWIELGSMCSNMHDENSCSGGSGPKATIWTSTDAYAAWSTYAALHTRMAPYLWSLAAEAHATGAPLIRHLFLDYPDHPELASVGDAYHFGPSLLVAPVVARGARSRTLALPAGQWLDWQAQSLVTSTGTNATVTLDAPLSKLPLLLEDGGLVPLLDPSVVTLDERPHPGIVGPNDVADVYDVVGFVTQATGKAHFALADGGTFDVTLAGAFSPPSSTMATSDADLASCAACWSQTSLAGGLARVRITAPDGNVTAGGLQLASHVGRRVRWDLYLVE